ncbi:hypothetical protein HET73_02130 [Wolbachia endosymbiont of Atemnus politus]|uniref:hypothetical protein n=1 Tax=Wolbachia endosymbiont of Atemnus politus TaxID=2682840 RepID=UPI00157425D8|nr:hypothetical protein [Wolbachia endosymbiont of Atemnus politus]NSM56398.1 hypothetical protein [Wolbachia endosymbiont of Atemnus politus]
MSIKVADPMLKHNIFDEVVLKAGSQCRSTGMIPFPGGFKSQCLYSCVSATCMTSFAM